MASLEKNPISDNPVGRIEWAYGVPGLSCRETSVLVYVCVRAGPNSGPGGHQCTAGLKRMSDDLSMPRRTLQETLDSLQAKGLLHRQDRGRASSALTYVDSPAKAYLESHGLDVWLNPLEDEAEEDEAETLDVSPSAGAAPPTAEGMAGAAPPSAGAAPPTAEGMAGAAPEQESFPNKERKREKEAGVASLSSFDSGRREGKEKEVSAEWRTELARRHKLRALREERLARIEANRRPPPPPAMVETEWQAQNRQMAAELAGASA